VTAKVVGSGVLFGAAGILTTKKSRNGEERTIGEILLRSVRLRRVADCDLMRGKIEFQSRSHRVGESHFQLPNASDNRTLPSFSRRRCEGCPFLCGRARWSARSPHCDRLLTPDTSKQYCWVSHRLLLFFCLPNVIDEPRPSLARRVRHVDS
jgi:hypothetical protein